MLRQGLVRSVCACAALAATGLLATDASAARHTGRHSLRAGQQDASTPYGQRTLKVGSHGSDVKELQGYLNDLKLRTAQDGVYGRTTAARVKAFQRHEGQHPDGKVTPSEALQIQQAATDALNGTGGASADSATSAPALAPGDRAQISSDGRTAIAPASAPQAVKDAIAAANQIVTKPYRYGGGHGSWDDSGYDCSGSVSYALHGGNLLDHPMDSNDFASWASPGEGHWITVWTNPQHAFAIIAGLRFDTSPGRHGGESGPRWRPDLAPTQGFTARHLAAY